jgi:hypothetical protein
MLSIILLLALMPGPSIMVPEPCEIATIDSDIKNNTDHVTVDWACVDKLDREFVADPTAHGEILAPMAHIMKAIRDGKAESK